MAVSYSRFTAMFPEFGDTASYAQVTVELWLQEADVAIGSAARRFGARFEMASMLFAAHYLALGKRDAAAASSGSVGVVTGPAQSKSVGPISSSYSIGSVLNTRADVYNLTVYGAQFYRMLKMASAGGLYIPSQGRYAPPGPNRL